MCNFMEDIKSAVQQAKKRNIEETKIKFRKHDELMEKQFNELLKEITEWISSLSLGMENNSILYLGLHLLRLPSKEIVMYVSLTNTVFTTNYHQLSLQSTPEIDLSNFFIYAQNSLSPMMKKVKEEKKEILTAFFKGIFINTPHFGIPTFYEI